MAYKSSQNARSETVDTSESSSSEEDEEDDSQSGKSSYCIKSHIEKIYNKLEGLKFKGVFERCREMELYRLPEATSRPVYLVTDTSVSDLLDKIYGNMKTLETELGEEVWKEITTGSGYKLWGTEESVEHSSDGMYRIPHGGIEVIVSGTLVKYCAIANITVEANS